MAIQQSTRSRYKEVTRINVTLAEIKSDKTDSPETRLLHCSHIVSKTEDSFYTLN